MNDRFKFRAWDSDNEVFDYIDLTDIEKTIRTLDSYENYFWSDYFKDKPEYIMQCTGLKDKNGKLIYEGDIVDIWKMAGNIHKRMVVKWYQPQCSFRLFDLSAMGATPQKMVDKRSLGAVTTIEVIGNIYENKELLEECE